VYTVKTSPVLFTRETKFYWARSVLVFDVQAVPASSCGGAKSSTAQVACLTSGITTDGEWGTIDVGASPGAPITPTVGKCDQLTENGAFTVLAQGLGSVGLSLPASGIVNINKIVLAYGHPVDHIILHIRITPSGTMTGSVEQYAWIQSNATGNVPKPICTTGVVTFSGRVS
jgi:hypothetical protein